MGHQAGGRRARNGARRHNTIARREDLPVVIGPSVGAPAINPGHRVFDAMVAVTDRVAAPATAVVGNDKRRARLSIIRRVWSTIEYAGKDEEIVHRPETPILGRSEPIGR
jgi:hypothetical protein